MSNAFCLSIISCHYYQFLTLHTFIINISNFINNKQNKTVVVVAVIQTIVKNHYQILQFFDISK